MAENLEEKAKETEGEAAETDFSGTYLPLNIRNGCILQMLNVDTKLIRKFVQAGEGVVMQKLPDGRIRQYHAAKIMHNAEEDGVYVIFRGNYGEIMLKKIGTEKLEEEK